MTTEEFQKRAGETVRPLPETVKMVILQPTAFFQTMPRTGGFVPPLVFLLLMSVIYAVIALVSSTITLGGVGGPEVFGVILHPIFAVIGAFIWAAILCVIWMTMGSKERFETSFRVVCYASALFPVFGILGLVPYLGVAISIAWGIWLTVVASVQVHRIEQKSAAMVFGIVGAALLAIGMGAEYGNRQVLQHLGESQGRFEGPDPTNPGSGAKILETVMEPQRQQTEGQ